VTLQQRTLLEEMDALRAEGGVEPLAGSVCAPSSEPEVDGLPRRDVAW